MNRRGFLSAVGAGLVAGSAVDPERLLWVPGQKLISIPQPLSVYERRLGDANLIHLIEEYTGGLKFTSRYFWQTDPKTGRMTKVRLKSRIERAGTRRVHRL